MPNRLINVTDDINALLEELDDGHAPDRQRLEHTLTDGYAWALKLDGECNRLERRMSELAALLARDNDEDYAGELMRVSRRLTRRRRELVELRQLLAALRAGRAQARVA
jgi:hypothetical protein